MGGGRCRQTCGLVVVDADAVELQVAVAMLGACGVDAVLVAYHLPKLQGKGGSERPCPHPGLGEAP